MAPDLVIADAPYKVYPGGVIAVKADEWMAASGTVTSGTETIACTGTYVEDTQTVTTDIVTDTWGAYAEATNTLEIDLNSLPMELGFFPYAVLISVRVLGEWDVTNLPALHRSNQDVFGAFAAVGFHGEGADLPEDGAEIQDQLPARRSYYGMIQYGAAAMFPSAPPGVLEVRAYAQAGTTISIRIDQLLFIPTMHNTFGPPINGWDTEDFQLVSPLSLPSPEDGADGGDENGKFTRVHALSDSNGWQGALAADFQEKTDGDSAEYLTHIVTADLEEIQNTQAPGTEPIVHIYGGHGARHKDSRVHTFDDFSRTIAVGSVGNNWGTTPEGYGWITGGIGADSAGVNGSAGFIRVGAIFPGTNATSAALTPYPTAPTTGAFFELNDYYSITGKWRFVPTAGWLGTPPPPSSFGTNAWIWCGEVMSSPTGMAFKFNLYSQDVIAGDWEFGYFDPSGGGLVADFHTLASGTIPGFADSAWIGFRIEKDRYRVRARVWDASGAEPGTWDFDDWRVLWSTVEELYDYGGDPDFSRNVYTNREFIFRLDVSNTAQPVDAEFDDLEVSYDPQGETPVDSFVRLERPDGTTQGEIMIPWGADYAVYWGVGDYTTDVAGDYLITFSSRHWVDEDKPLLERGETMWWWFRSVHAALIPMNWRSADRSPQGQNRILTGG